MYHPQVLSGNFTETEKQQLLSFRVPTVGEEAKREKPRQTNKPFVSTTVSVWGLGNFTTLTSVESGLFSLFLLRLKFSQVVMTLVSEGEDCCL